MTVSKQNLTGQTRVKKKADRLTDGRTQIAKSDRMSSPQTTIK